MKRLSFYSIILLCCILWSCKDKSGFTISGTIINPGSIKKVYLFRGDSAGLVMADSTSLGENGKFVFKGKTSFANLYDIRVGNGGVFDLIAKNGDDITFSTNLSDTGRLYTITGSDDSEKIKEFNSIDNVYNKKIGRITEQYRAESEKLGHESDSLVQIYLPLVNEQLKGQATAILAFAGRNKNSLAGFLRHHNDPVSLNMSSNWSPMPMI